VGAKLSGGIVADKFGGEIFIASMIWKSLRWGEIFFALIIYDSLPILGIIANILADAVQFVGVADDVFVIIALPNILDVGILMHPFGYPDFKPANDGTNGLGWRTERRGI
jgi:hypothetical protein